MKKLFILALSLSLACLPLLSACGDKNTPADPADYGYGPSLDGAAIEGEWQYSEEGVTSSLLSQKGVLYKTGSKTDYTFGFTAELKETDEEKAAAFGGYAYYKDASNYVEFMIDPEEKTMEVESVKGYDRQPITASLAADTDFSEPLSLRRQGRQRIPFLSGRYARHHCAGEF